MLRGRQREAARGRLAARWACPLFVKPANLGSSVGVSKVKRAEDLDAALDLAFAYDRKVVVEAAARRARDRGLGPRQRRARRRRCRARSSPTASSTTTTPSTPARAAPSCAIPAPLRRPEAREARDLARARLPGRGRVRLRAGRLPPGPEDAAACYVNEINTIPGFTSISMFPKLWEATGLALRRPPRPPPRPGPGAARTSGARLRTDYRPDARPSWPLCRGAVAASPARPQRPGLSRRPRAPLRRAGRPALRRGSASSPGAPGRSRGPSTSQALVLAWKLEQRPDSRRARPDAPPARGPGDRGLADARLRVDPDDVRALLGPRSGPAASAAGCTSSASQQRDAARAAVQMREDLPRSHRPGIPETADALFGLGLYDYYVDVLPRIAKLLRFLSGMPGGDRERGLARIEAAAEGIAPSTRRRRAVQLYEIYAFYEKDPDRARRATCAALRRRYPGSPLWGAQAGRAPARPAGRSTPRARPWRARCWTPARRRPARLRRRPRVALARLSLGESLLLDLRPADARRALLPVLTERPEPRRARGARPPAPRAAASSWRATAKAPSPTIDARPPAPTASVQARAEAALAAPLSGAPRCEGIALAGRGPAPREAGRQRGSGGAGVPATPSPPGPACREAALMRRGGGDARGRPRDEARGTSRRRETTTSRSRPGCAPGRACCCARHARPRRASGRDAVGLYKEVLKHPYGRAELREAAEEGCDGRIRRRRSRRSVVFK